MSTSPTAPTPASQTLSRGIKMLELLAAATGPRTIGELAEDLGVHRSIAYRILRTLEDHRLVMRDDSGRVQAAPGLAALARGVQRDLQAAALPELTGLANELGMSAFIAVWDQHECTTLLSVEPRHATVVQRPGSRHPFAQGAPGIAIQSTLTATQWSRLAPDQDYRAAAVEARAAGYARSQDEVIKGVSSVAAPLHVPGQLPAAVGVVYATASGTVDESVLGQRLSEAARAIERVLGG